jgi:hypothetical protein
MTFRITALDLQASEPSPVTERDIYDLMETLRVGAQEPLVWRVSGLVRNRMARRFLAARKAWPAKRRFRRSVTRAYRKSGGLP